MKYSTSERLKELMKIYGISQTELTNKLGLAKSTVSQYVSGKRIPKQNILTLISEKFGIDEAWLMGYDVPMRQEENAGDVLADVFNDTELMDHVTKLNSLSDSEKKLVYDMIDTLYKKGV